MEKACVTLLHGVILVCERTIYIEAANRTPYLICRAPNFNGNIGIARPIVSYPSVGRSLDFLLLTQVT